MDFEALLNAHVGGDERKPERERGGDEAFLVILAAGDGSLHDKAKPWNEDGRFDLCIVYYGTNDETAAKYRGQAKYFLQSEGPKWQLMRRALKECSWRKYAYIWMPDDDLRIDPIDILRMFRIAQDDDLLMGQPALLDVNIQPQYRKIIKRREGVLLHYSNFVEIMCPFFRVDALEYVQHTFDSDDAKSGWGLDMLWPTMLNFQGIGVIDATPVEHTRPQQAFGVQSSFYNRFKIDPQREYFDLQRRFNFRDFRKRTFEEVPDKNAAKSSSSASPSDRQSPREESRKDEDHNGDPKGEDHNGDPFKDEPAKRDEEQG
ncbi:Hypothetical Protein FCC1311_019422 [Hondaea fermentalgiana]|uniref:Uncharacterized protein n=1 Tax=Hondaea fermentalgiana TaxID=2315210 RepID=A0A2R5GAZ4_9STRA|nr:Hypothetical Protein FCC1311_019422 [Hondaea fermentalgiana]|eukprot:GBG25723.1 Hypothetical Protein FCC1311_019422 [Hondaea fermentalgiana]